MPFGFLTLSHPAGFGEGQMFKAGAEIKTAHPGLVHGNTQSPAGVNVRQYSSECFCYDIQKSSHLSLNFENLVLATKLTPCFTLLIFKKALICASILG